MLIGEYSPTLDAKGRLNFPAKLRDELGGRFIITKGLDNCLFVYPMEEWKLLEDRIKALPMSKARNLQRFLFASACEAQVDAQGRVLIPGNLREYASLEKETVVIGASVRAEIWSRSRWDAACEELTSDMIVEAMEELGF